MCMNNIRINLISMRPTIHRPDEQSRNLTAISSVESDTEKSYSVIFPRKSSRLIARIHVIKTKLKQSNVNFTAKKQLNVIFFSRKTNQIRNLFLPIPVYCKSLLGGFSELKEKKRKKIKGKSLQVHNKLEYTQDNKFVKVTIVSVEHRKQRQFLLSPKSLFICNVDLFLYHLSVNFPVVQTIFNNQSLLKLAIVTQTNLFTKIKQFYDMINCLLCNTQIVCQKSANQLVIKPSSCSIFFFLSFSFSCILY